MDDNIVKFEKPAEQDNTPPAPKMFNIPPLCFWTLVAIIVIHAVQVYTPLGSDKFWWGLAFVPARYGEISAIWPWGVISPVSHIFLHGNWMHVAMNGLMFLAFGSAAERMLGARDAALLFILCGLCGAFAQFLIMPASPYPMVGASGALSGLFAAVIMHMQRVGAMPAGRFGIWGIAALWVGISFISAVVGGSVGMGNIAWAAHAGGFLGGILFMRTIFKNA